MTTAFPAHVLLALPLAEVTRAEGRSIVLVLLASTLGALLSRWHPVIVLPTVVVEIVLGIVIGPDVLDIASANEYLSSLSSFGLAFLFFFAGLEARRTRDSQPCAPRRDGAPADRRDRRDRRGAWRHLGRGRRVAHRGRDALRARLSVRRDTARSAVHLGRGAGRAGGGDGRVLGSPQ